MSKEEILSQLQTNGAGKKFNKEIEALVLIGQGEWDRAHNIVQDMQTQNAAWIHGLLHWEEGDLWNADYWYRKAGETRPLDSTIDQEWERIAITIIDQQ